MSHAAADSHAPLDPGIRLRLSLMMFLQYFVWGSWFVTLSSYLLGNSGDKGAKLFETGFTGAAYGTAAIGGMIAPFFVGMIADRFFSSERILAFLHVVGAGVLFYISTITNQQLLYLSLIAYFVCYMPTLALSNSLSMHNLPDPAKQFPSIRVLGTIGWIAAGWLVGNYLKIVDGGLTFALGGDGASIEATTYPMKVAAIAQAVLGIYCISLPHTPPKNKGVKVTVGDVLGLDALRLLKHPPFAVFVVGSFLVAIPLQYYYNYANGFLKGIGVANPAGVMTWGQISEFFFMLLIPVFFARLGVKYMLLIGMACWAIRYTLFAYGNAPVQMWMLYLGILLHGICYDFFFVTGQLYVDREADPRIRGAAQGFIAFVTLGVGSFIGAYLSGLTEVASTMKLVLDGKESDAVNWKQFWLYPAAGAAVVLVLFAVTFFDRVRTKADTIR